MASGFTLSTSSLDGCGKSIAVEIESIHQHQQEKKKEKKQVTTTEGNQIQYSSFDCQINLPELPTLHPETEVVVLAGPRKCISREFTHDGTN